MARVQEFVVTKKSSNADSKWDPTVADIDEILWPKTSRRIMIDIMECLRVDPQRIFVVPDSDNVLMAHVVIVGSAETPYEGGFFYFFIRFPNNYPMSPPKIKLMNTDQGKLSFNPHIHKSGMVCLNILGTEAKEDWSPLNTLSSVLLSIQAVMDNDTFHSCPVISTLKGWDEECPEKYAEFIRHETMRVAVVDFLKEDNVDVKQMPEAMLETVKMSFKQNIPFYFKTIIRNMFMDGIHMFDANNCTVEEKRFNYRSIKTELIELAKKYQTDRAVLRETFITFGIPVGDIEEVQVQSECSELSESD